MALSGGATGGVRLPNLTVVDVLPVPVPCPPQCPPLDADSDRPAPGGKVISAPPCIFLHM
jgi:hypothetical protein